LLKKIFTSTETELKEKIKELEGKDKELEGKDNVIVEKNNLIVEKNKLLLNSDEKLAQVNAKHLKEIGDFSLRRVIENVESVKLFRDLKFQLKMKTIKDEKTQLTYVKEKNYAPSRQSVWTKLLATPESTIRFPNLTQLAEDSSDVDVPKVISQLHNFSSKGIHSYEVKSVFIDTSLFSPREVLLYR
jgi:hypothetical protein